MKNIVHKVLLAVQAVQEARQRRINERSLAELDAHTLRDIGLDRARIEAVRYRVHFGLF